MQIVRKLRRSSDCSHPVSCLNQNVASTFCGVESIAAAMCVHTADGRPWELDLFVQFSDEPRALAFERNLKSGSGFAFAKRHFRC
jgi:hypothetical protein